MIDVNKARELITQEDKFPTAQAPGAMTEGDVFARWREKGLEPVEITPDKTIQRIEITHDPIKGELKWQASANMDGLGVTLNALAATILMPSVITADAAMSIAEYFTTGAGQLDLGTGKAAVIIGFDNGRLALDWEPKDAPIAAKKLLATALLFMVSKDAGLPIERLLRAFGND